MPMTEAQIADVLRRTDDGAPEGFPTLAPLAAGRYRDPAFAELETESVFGRTWLFVAHADQLRDRGDYVVADQLRRPILLVRDDGGRVRAFHNTCTHRGSALVLDTCGNTGRRITCPYHSWSFGLDGALLGVPGADAFPELDPACHALGEVRCESWGPFVFVNLDPQAAPLTEHLDVVAEDLSDISGADGAMHLVGHTERVVEANWKLPVDANIETYHVATVHRNTAAKVLQSTSTGIQLLRNGHSRMLVRARDGIDLGAHLPFPAVVRSAGELPSSGTFSYSVFPNLNVVFSGSGFMFLITNWPVSPGTSRYDVHWCSSLPPDSEENRQVNGTFVSINQDVLFEDLTVLPGIQASIDAGTIGSFRLGAHERRIYHHHEAIDRAIGPDRVPPDLRVPPLLDRFVEP